MTKVAIHLLGSGARWGAYSDEPKLRVGGTSRLAALDQAHKQLEVWIGTDFDTVVINERPAEFERCGEILKQWGKGVRPRDWPVEELSLRVEDADFFSDLEPLLLVYYHRLDRGKFDEARHAIDQALRLFARYGGDDAQAEIEWLDAIFSVS